MADVFTPAQRSALMSRVRSSHTKPELALRRALHALGFRYRLHDRRLPGTPDIVLPRYGAVVQVQGCFWHGHSCKDGRAPGSRQDYWLPKLEANAKRDKRNARLLRHLGWRVITVWECTISSRAGLERESRRIARLLRALHDG